MSIIMQSSTGKVSFKWQHHRISSLDLKVTVTNNLAITWLKIDEVNFKTWPLLILQKRCKYM